MLNLPSFAPSMDFQLLSSQCLEIKFEKKFKKKRQEFAAAILKQRFKVKKDHFPDKKLRGLNRKLFKLNKEKIFPVKIKANFQKLIWK